MSHRVTPGAWILRPKPDSGARLRLFCLPFAGGGASTYHAWSSVFPRDIEICAVQLPGRESRMHERRVTDALVLAEAIADAVAPHLDRMFALFGYSMGSLLAFETARALRRRRLPMPAQLFVAAMRAPHVAGVVPPLSRLPQDQLVRAVRSHYQPPEDVFEIPELVDLYLPILRDDMALVDDYVYQAEAPLSCAIDAYVGAHDRSTSAEANERWREQTTGEFAQTIFLGSHFFLRDALPAVQRHVMSRLSCVMGGRR